MSAIYLKRADLLAACKAAQAIAPAGDMAPHLKDARITAKSGKLVIFATNVAMEITRQVPADQCPEIGTLYAPIRELTSAVGKLGEEQVALNVVRGKVVLQAGRTEIRVSCAHESVMPDGMDFTGTGVLTVDAGDLALALRRTAYAIAAGTNRYGLNGLYVERRDEVLRLVSTDGHRLAWAELPCRGAGELPCKQLLPPALLSAVLRGNDAGDVDVEFGPGKARFTRSDEVLTGILLEGEFPDYRAVLPGRDQRHSVRVNRTALATALARQPRESHARWDLADGLIRLTTCTTSVDVVEVIDEVPAEVDGGPLSFGAETAYALDCVTSFGGEHMVLAMKSALSPILAYEPDNERQQAVVMPRRLD